MQQTRTHTIITYTNANERRLEQRATNTRNDRNHQQQQQQRQQQQQQQSQQQQQQQRQRRHHQLTTSHTHFKFSRRKYSQHQITSKPIATIPSTVQSLKRKHCNI